MSDTQEFDVLVIGGGPGGYVAALRASQLGLSCGLVEANDIGGICLNWGCIPTKALLKSAEIYRQVLKAADYGLKVDNVGFDLDEVVGRSRRVSGQLTSGVNYLLKRAGVTVIKGWAVLSEANKVTVQTDAGQQTIAAKHIILATGAKSRNLPNLSADGDKIWNYKHALQPTEIPKKLLVIGSGAIGMEFASFYQSFGSEVTVVEVLDRILPNEDADISAFAEQSFNNQGMAIHTSANIAQVTVGKKKVKVQISLADGGELNLSVDKVILAVGISANIEDIGLEALGVTTDRGHIVVDEFSNTNVADIYAIGDVAAPPWLAHKAMHEGVACVEKIAGLATAHPVDLAAIPGCTYCHPQIASLGLTEQAAKDQNIEIKVGKLDLNSVGKAIAIGDSDGFVKTIFSAATGELLGAHMIGPDVTELIQGFGIAKTLETTEQELINTVFAHPTLSEAMHESVLDAYGIALHQ